MIHGEQQQKEIATIKERTFKLNLSDADVTRLAIKAAKAGMSMEELLASFIGDLVCGTYSNGSDERMYAEEWYDRCGFSHFLGNDIARLANDDALEVMVDYCKAYQSAIEDLENTKADLADPECDDVFEEDVQNAEDYLASCREDIEETMSYSNCEGSLEQVVAAVLKWDEELQQRRTGRPVTATSGE